MEDFWAMIILILVLISFFIAGQSCAQKFDKTMMCKQLYTKTIDYEQCKVSKINDIYKLIKSIDEE